MDLPLLKELVVIFCLSILVIYACYHVKIPSIVGFLLTGMLCGPYGLAIVNAVHEVEILAEVGVVMLMFSIGLELSIGELVRLRKPVFMGGGLQVILTILGFAGIAVLFGFTPGPAIFTGFLVALSSTAIVLKLLQQMAQVETPHGRITLSILIFQDLIIVPMMLATPFLAGAHASTDSHGMAMIMAGLKTLAIIGTVFLLARKLVPLALRAVIRTRSKELFLIATLGICLLIAWITSLLGLSLSLGAFLAGLIMAESEYSHTALEGILPFRDVFTSIFFTSVGMLLNLGFFVSHIGQVTLAFIAVLAGKGIIAALVTRLLGYPLRPALLVGLALCQVGEFSFVLAKVGISHSLLTGNQYQLFLAASILSMAAAPFLLSYGPQISAAICTLPLVRSKTALTAAAAPQPESGHESHLSDHLIIIGFGVGGKYLARTAKRAGIAYTILEMNPDTVRLYAAKGEPIAHGDATYPAVLASLGIQRARVLAIVISDPAAVRSITETARKMAHGVHIVVRTRFLGEVNALEALGANDVIPEELETAVEIFTRVLSRYLVPRATIEHFVNEIRAENYQALRTLEMPGTSFESFEKQMPGLNITALEVEEGSQVEGLSLIDSNLRKTANITVIAVKRKEEIFGNPDGAFTLLTGDIAYVFGSPDDVADATPLFSRTTDAQIRHMWPISAPAA